MATYKELLEKESPEMQGRLHEEQNVSQFALAAALSAEISRC